MIKYSIVLKLRTWCHLDDINSSFIFSLIDYIWRLFVQSNTEALNLMLYQSLVNERFSHIQDYHNQVTSPSNSNDLFTSAFTVFCALYDTWQV